MVRWTSRPSLARPGRSALRQAGLGVTWYRKMLTPGPGVAPLPTCSGRATVTVALGTEPGAAAATTSSRFRFRVAVTVATARKLATDRPPLGASDSRPGRAGRGSKEPPAASARGRPG